MNMLPSIQHWLLCKDAVVKAPAKYGNPYDLEKVSYQFRVPVGANLSLEHPKIVEQVVMFARFFNGLGSHDFEIVVGLHTDDDEFESVETYGPYTIHFRDGEPARDFAFRLRKFPLCGLGVYSVQLVALEVGQFEPLAIEYFEVIEQ
jgi:hypothetical protein